RTWSSARALRPCLLLGAVRTRDVPASITFGLNRTLDGAVEAKHEGEEHQRRQYPPPSPSGDQQTAANSERQQGYADTDVGPVAPLGGSVREHQQDRIVDGADQLAEDCARFR